VQNMMAIISDCLMERSPPLAMLMSVKQAISQSRDLYKPAADAVDLATMHLQVKSTQGHPSAWAVLLEGLTPACSTSLHPSTQFVRYVLRFQRVLIGGHRFV